MAHPAHIGRYRVLGVLGQGAMGIVYRGHDDSLDREVALKVMGAGRGADPDTVARFRREAKAVARLQHPNIITIYELGEHDGAPYMAMELLTGMDLQQAIEAGIRPDPKITLPIMLHVLAGLGHAHEHGIVHRDIKPSNIFLPRGRPAKVTDFGVARLAGSVTSSGVVGTPNYMSPEQVNGTGIDGRSDLFSAGLILYELVTGEKAYRADSVVSVFYKIAHEDVDMRLLPQEPAWARLRGVLARSLAKEPEARHLDARAMAADLLRALQDLGGSPDAATPSDRALLRSALPRTPHPMPRSEEASPPATPPRPATPEPAPRPTPGPVPTPAVTTSSRRGLLLSVGGALAALAAAAVAVVVMRTPEARPSPAPSAVPSALPSVGPSPTVSARPASLPPKSATPSPLKASPATATSPTTDASVEGPGVSPQNARLERANQLFEKGRYQAALNEARAVLAREPGNAEAKALLEDAEVAIVVETRLRSAQAAVKRGDRDGALVEVRAGLAANPSDARLLALFRELTQ
ncbi:MAG TPA: protein kinase [Vicinamibacteria bacterium]|nr:protein kinase [Vicinamibacteria bacterium]